MAQRVSQQTIRYSVFSPSPVRVSQQVIRIARTITPPPTPPVTPSATTFRIRRERIPPTVFSDGKRVLHRRLQLDCQPGIGHTTDPGAVPTLLVYTSDDGGNTWQGPREMFPGQIGQYAKQMRLYQLGSAYNRVYKVVCDSPNAWVIAQAFLDIDGASS